jgi:TrkA domain protein
MSDIREVKLPGVGIRYEFDTEDGKRMGVLTHRSGRRELFIGSSYDPDQFKRLVGLSQTDARTLAELWGASRVAEQLADLQQRIQGLVIDWLPVRDDAAYVGRTIGDTRIRTRTGVSVVAVVREEDATPAPGPDAVMHAGDYLVVVGTARGIEQVVELLHKG